MSKFNNEKVLSPNRVDSLIKTMLPVDTDLEFPTSLLSTRFSQSLLWQSMLLIGQNQIQRNGLLFQAALTNAELGKQVTCIMKKEFNRFPPTTDGMPKMKPDNMANITLKYCREYRNIEDLLLSFCDFPNDLLPDVLIVNGLDEYFESKDNTIQFCFARMLSLLSETVEYIGRRKNTKSLLYVSGQLINHDAIDTPDLIDLLKTWVHEVWVLEGNSNRLVCGTTQIQFSVLGPDIFLKTIKK